MFNPEQAKIFCGFERSLCRQSGAAAEDQVRTSYLLVFKQREPLKQESIWDINFIFQ